MALKIICTMVTLTACIQHSCSFRLEGNDTERVEYVFLTESKSPCLRSCTKGETPMVCRYSFHLEWYYSMSKACYDCPRNVSDCFRPDCVSVDGSKRPVTVVNRHLPGPSIEVCLGDEVIIEVQNDLMTDSTTIHWHGHHQKFTPYMDGVPLVTQCAIPPGSSFRYNFVVNNAGTHFWHSHSGMQRADGVFGGFIVRVPKEDDPHSHLYDFDLSAHKIQILDWNHVPGLQQFLAHHNSNGDNKVETMLINGLGRFVSFNTSRGAVYMPTATFTVQQGYRFRFRLINAQFLNCPVEISIDNHNITVISSDGFDFEPVEAESLVMYAGERFDIIVKADKNIANYWIRFRGLMDCDERFKSAQQLAILHYDGAPENEDPDGRTDYESSRRTGMQVNSLNTPLSETTTLSMPELHSLEPPDITLKPIPDYKYYIGYDFYPLDNPRIHRQGLYGFYNVTDSRQQVYTPQLNHITFKYQSFPLLSQRDLITSDMFCNETSVKGCNETYCECTHVLQIPLNAVVELVLVDMGVVYDANHPFHLHGNAFRVISMDKINSSVTVEQVQQLDAEGLIYRNLVDPPYKDTVTVPDGGYTIIRFHAWNPGYWLFHCHIEFHAELGMALVFKVGEHSDMPPVPEEFPRCGNWKYKTDIASSKSTTDASHTPCDTTGGNETVMERWHQERNAEEPCASSNQPVSINVSFFTYLNVIIVIIYCF